MDEYNLSGASSINSTYGLTNTQVYWTLTPINSSNAWLVAASGSLLENVVTDPYGIRPVINVSKNSIITEGTGTLKNAYILNQSTNDKTGKLNEESSSGEYVILNNKTYRVVSKDVNGIKLIYDGYYEEIKGTTYKMAFGTNNIFSTNAGIGQKLNTDVLSWIGFSNKIVELNWYATTGIVDGTKYTDVLTNTGNSVKAKVGLIGIVEILSGQSASILTNNYNVRSSRLNTEYYWTINRHTNSSMTWLAYDDGFSNDQTITGSFAIRPVIVVNNDTMITSGNGTLENPYVIDSPSFPKSSFF